MVSWANSIKALKRLSGIASLALALFVMSATYAQQTHSVEHSEPIKDQVYMVRGAVSRPGVYRSHREAALVELIASAGGLTQDHGSFVYLFRAIKNQSEPQIDRESFVCLPDLQADEKKNLDAVVSVRYDLLRVHTNGILSNKFSQPLRFPSGSIVNIPIGAVFFVTGDVSLPGSFRYQVGTTLRHAILLANGRTNGAAPCCAIIYRVDPQTCIEREIIVDLNAAGTAEVTDIDIHPDDIVSVDSRALGFECRIPLAHLLNTSHPN